MAKVWRTPATSRFHPRACGGPSPFPHLGQYSLRGNVADARFSLT